MRHTRQLQIRLVFVAACLWLACGAAHATDEPDVTCESTVGACRVVAAYDFGSSTETELMVAPVADEPFLTTLHFPGQRSSTVGWNRPTRPRAECEETVQCENGEVIDCFREGPCSSGRTGFSVHCGMFLPVRDPWMPEPSLEATVKTCRGLADPWPDLPKPHPNPPNPPKPPGKPGPEKPGDEPEGDPEPPAGACTLQQIRDAATTLVDYHETIHVKTTKRRPGSSLPGNFESEIVVRHDAPSATHVVAVVATDDGPERHEVIHLGDVVYWHTPEGPWLEIDRRRLAGSPMQPPDPAVADHDQYGPRGMVEGIEPDDFRYVGTGACEGVLDRDTCHAFLFHDDGLENTAYFSTGSCRLRSVIGVNAEGPRTIVVDYRDETVEKPTGEIVALTGDPKKDMQLMMRFMRPPG